MDRITEQIRNDNGPAPKWKKVTGFYVPPIGKITHSTFVVSNPARVKEVFQLLNVYETEEEAKKAMEAKSAKTAPPPRVVLKRSPEAGVPVSAPVAPAPVLPPVQEAFDKLIEAGAARMKEVANNPVEAVEVLSERAKNPTTETEFVAALRASNQSPPLSWDASLRSAIALVLAEMKSTRVLSLTLTQDGKMSYKREEVVVVIKDGSMTVSMED